MTGERHGDEWNLAPRVVAIRAFESDDPSRVVVEHAHLFASPSRQLVYALDVATLLAEPLNSRLTLADIMLQFSRGRRDEYFALHYLQGLRFECSLLGLRAEFGADIGTPDSLRIAAPAVGKIQTRLLEVFSSWEDAVGAGALVARAIALAIDDRCHPTFAAAREADETVVHYDVGQFGQEASRKDAATDRFPHSNVDATPHLHLTPRGRVVGSSAPSRLQSATSEMRSVTRDDIIEILIQLGTGTSLEIFRRLESQGMAAFPGDTSDLFAQLYDDKTIEVVPAPLGRDRRDRFYRLRSE
ncbi:MAG: hypothetical protein M3256_22245 [Actinomycetota bacterium]|nr:hypothetical protein [Actinomycetota bacterium]